MHAILSLHVFPGRLICLCACVCVCACAHRDCRQKASELIGKCNSQKLHMQYAKAMEANGQYELAAKSYVQSKEYVPAIR